jgi:exonuclease SbcD
VGLAEQVRELFPNAVDIRIESPSGTTETAAQTRTGRTPHELFESYLDEQQVDDPRLVVLFDELLQEAGDAAVGAEVSIDAS